MQMGIMTRLQFADAQENLLMIVVGCLFTGYGSTFSVEIQFYHVILRHTLVVEYYVFT